ncbi:MAG: hypothetical protein GY792_37980 [Gammaproteobacteria bacterium]|nr:hypothetical protein [Gammaproteobacteria bacterium]
MDFDPLEINSHRKLVSNYGAIVQRINEQPELSVLLLINPVLALKELNIKVSKPISNHILHAMQHTPLLKKRREALENELAEKLGNTPQPNNPKWLANLLFNELKIKPLAIRGEMPVYKSALDPKRLAALQKLRPEPRRKYKAPVRRRGNLRLQVAQWNGAARRMEIDAPVPELGVLDAAPKEVTLEELFFYKDLSPDLKNLLELGIIQRQGFPFHSGDSYRKVKNGSKANAFRGWIRSVKFSED